MDPLDADAALASGLDSFYEDGRIYNTKTGVRPDEDWGELRFRCAEMDDGIPPDIADWYRADPALASMVHNLSIAIKYGDLKCHLARLEYEEILVACVIIITSPRKDGVAMAHNIAISTRNCPRCRLQDLPSLLLSAAARELRIAYLFAQRHALVENKKPLGLDPECAARFDALTSSIFSPNAPSHHPWLHFGRPHGMAYNARQVFARECAVVAPGKASSYSLGELVFCSDNEPWDGPYLVTEPFYYPRAQRWGLPLPLGEVEDEAVPCPAPNYAAAAPNMFLTRFLERSPAPILYIIDCQRLCQKWPLPRAPTHPNVGLAIMMAHNRRLGNNSKLGGLDESALSQIYGYVQA